MNRLCLSRLVIVGVGLIGGSVAAALKKAGCVSRIIGVGRSRANTERALALGVIDEVSPDLQVAAHGADCVMICVPVQQTVSVLQQLRGAVQDGVIVSDAGSTKRDFVRAVRSVIGAHAPSVVPGHPIAGAEHSGVEAASATLFVGKRVVLTPLRETAVQAVDTIEGLWRACGADVTRMDPEHHDRVFSAVSHLPHVLAYSLVALIASRGNARELFSFAAGGFRDFTRIAASSPEMWRDICVANRDAIAGDIDDFQHALAVLKAQISAGDGAQIERLFEAARRAREAWIDGSR